MQLLCCAFPRCSARMLKARNFSLGSLPKDDLFVLLALRISCGKTHIAVWTINWTWPTIRISIAIYYILDSPPIIYHGFYHFSFLAVFLSFFILFSFFVHTPFSIEFFTEGKVEKPQMNKINIKHWVRAERKKQMWTKDETKSRQCLR